MKTELEKLYIGYLDGGNCFKALFDINKIEIQKENVDIC